MFTLLAATLWGTSFPLVKWSLEYVSPYVLVTLRFLLASVILLPVAFLSARERFFTFFPKPYLLLLGLINGVGYFLQFVGQSLTTAINASLLLNTSVIFASIFSSLWLNEQLGPKKTMGILITFLGTILIVTEGRFKHLSSGTTVGDLLCLSGGMAWGVYTVISKKTSKPKENSLLFTSTMLLYTFLAVFTFSMPFFHLKILPLKIWLSVLYISIFCTAIPFLLWYEGLKRIEASSSAVYLLFMIIVATILSIFFLLEPFTPMIGIGSLLVGGGIWLTERSTSSSNV